MIVGRRFNRNKTGCRCRIGTVRRIIQNHQPAQNKFLFRSAVSEAFHFFGSQFFQFACYIRAVTVCNEIGFADITGGRFRRQSFFAVFGRNSRQQGLFENIPDIGRIQSLLFFLRRQSGNNFVGRLPQRAVIQTAAGKPVMMKIAEIANGHTDANRFSFQFRNVFNKRVGLFEITVIRADMVAFAARAADDANQRFVRSNRLRRFNPIRGIRRCFRPFGQKCKTDAAALGFKSGRNFFDIHLKNLNLNNMDKITCFV